MIDETNMIKAQDNKNLFLKSVFATEVIPIFYWSLYIVLPNEVSVEESIKFKIKERVRACVCVHEIIHRSVVWPQLVKALSLSTNVPWYIYQYATKKFLK